MGSMNKINCPPWYQFWTAAPNKPAPSNNARQQTPNGHIRHDVPLVVPGTRFTNFPTWAVQSCDFILRQSTLNLALGSALTCIGLGLCLLTYMQWSSLFTPSLLFYAIPTLLVLGVALICLGAAGNQLHQYFFRNSNNNPEKNTTNSHRESTSEAAPAAPTVEEPVDAVEEPVDAVEEAAATTVSTEAEQAPTAAARASTVAELVSPQDDALRDVSQDDLSESGYDMINDKLSMNIAFIQEELKKCKNPEEFIATLQDRVFGVNDSMLNQCADQHVRQKLHHVKNYDLQQKFIQKISSMINEDLQSCIKKNTDSLWLSGQFCRDITRGLRIELQSGYKIQKIVPENAENSQAILQSFFNNKQKLIYALSCLLNQSLPGMILATLRELETAGCCSLRFLDSPFFLGFSGGQQPLEFKVSQLEQCLKIDFFMQGHIALLQTLSGEIIWNIADDTQRLPLGYCKYQITMQLHPSSEDDGFFVKVEDVDMHLKLEPSANMSEQ